MDSEISGTMEVAALGRPFSLGMLYDCRKDSLVPGMKLWDHDDLIKHIGERQQNYNDFEIVASESIDDKSSALDVEASLKASFLGGLVQVDGSAKYLNNSKTSKNQARVTLKYKATTKVQELSMNHLGTGNVKHPYVFEKGLATHVVTAILYGAQAFFVFDREVSQDEDHQDIEGDLKVMIKKIPGLAIEGKGALKMEDKDKANVDKFSCSFFGDFSLKKMPTSYQEAIQVYKSLPELLGENGENAIPMKVWLLPLTAIDSTAAKLVCQISLGLVQQCQSVLEDFSELEMRCNDALKTTIVHQFPQIGKKIKTFKDMCSEFKLGFQMTLAKILPSIRGGGEEEDVLAEILKKRHSSPFNRESLNEWMDCKEREIHTIMSLTTTMKNTKTVPSQNELYKESLKTEHALCFVFTSVGSDEPFLSALSNYLRKTPEPDNLQDSRTQDLETEQWYASRDKMSSMRKKAKIFSDFAEANKGSKNIKFLTAGIKNEAKRGSSIYLYKDGFSVSEDFEPPSKPESVTVTDINHNSVTLKIDPPKSGSEDITSYSVEYCVSGEEEWKQQTASKAEEVKVGDLSPDTEYMFRCRAVTSVGLGPTYEVTIQTKSLTMTKEVLKERQQLEVSVEGLQIRVKNGLAKLEEIKETAEKLKAYEAEISRNENFKIKVTVKKPFQVDFSGTGKYLTNCQQCNFTCHDECIYAADKDKINCSAMGSDGKCTVCPGKCIWSVHFHQKYKWEYKDVTEVKTVDDLKKKYDIAKQAKSPVEALIGKLKAEYNAVQAEVEKLMEGSTKCLNRLKQIALRPNPLSTPEYIDMLIEGEKNEAKPGWKKRVQSLTEMREKAKYIAQVERGETPLAKNTDYTPQKSFWSRLFSW
ncbi:stonustoxin subunit alpha-like isoform X2 [Halichoeres trimaculatus]|uniref:stonustoxin subunit alpha-like isoform X2 n=1 Tax=Halichoeres trimaculatus TaxID=147232 RepID=UPI003D9ED470